MLQIFFMFIPPWGNDYFSGATVSIYLYTKFYASQVVVWDFFHQQYHELPILDLLFLLVAILLNPDDESWFIA